MSKIIMSRGEWFYVIVVRVAFGLGNQLFLYAVGRRIAKVLNTELKLDVSFYHEHKDDPSAPRPFLLDRFCTKLSFATDEEIELCKKNKIINSWEFDLQSVDIDNSYLMGDGQEIRYFSDEDLNKELKQELVLKGELSKLGQALKNEIIHSECPVSLNVRRGDYLSPYERENFGVCSFQYYKDAILNLKEKFSKITLYITSDDMAYVKERFSVFENDGVKIRYIEGIDDVEVLYILTFCQHHIIPNSTFAWWIAWLGRNEDKTVFAPTPWFTIHADKPLYFPTWTKLPRGDKKFNWGEHYISHDKPGGTTYFIVRRQEDRVGLFSNYLVFAGSIRYALEKGYLPVIDMKNYYNHSLMSYDMVGKENVWEWFFLQPFEVNLDDALKSENVLIGNGGLAYPFPNPDEAFFTDKDGVLTEWRMLRKLGYLRIRPELQDEFVQYFNKLFSKEDRVLGVRIRGTDRIALRPKYYPVSPPVEYAVSTVERYLKEWGCNKIYLSTEDPEIAIAFENHFGMRCVVSQQERPEYDGKGLLVYYGKKTREALYRRGKEYLRDVAVLSMCNSFITHRCSASIAVMMMSDGFENVLAFDFGEYGCQSEKEKSKGKDIVWRKADIISVEEKHKITQPLEEIRLDSFDGTWRNIYRDAVMDTVWLQKKSVGRESVKEVGFNFLYPLYRILDEFHPKSILELEFDQASKVTAQYAKAYKTSHVIFANDRERVEHFIRCWGISLHNTVIYGSTLIEDDRNFKGVLYQNFTEVTRNQMYELILLKCPQYKEELYAHVDVLQRMPDILCKDFVILMDHVEEDCCNRILESMIDILRKNNIKFLRKDFSSQGRIVSALASATWKYIEEF